MSIFFKSRKVLLCSLILWMMFGAAYGESFNVATWNLRYVNEKDSLNGNGWGKRLPYVAQMVLYYDFDILGTQEHDSEPTFELSAMLPEYEYVNLNLPEVHPIFYRKDKFTLLDKGQFWYSDSSDVVGKGWDAYLIRFCTWAKFKYDNHEFFVFNAHFDHKGKLARENSARLTMEKVSEISGGAPSIFLGDLNSLPDSDPLGILREWKGFSDARDRAKIVYAPNGSYNHFNPKHYNTKQIDYIFVADSILVQRYGVLNDSYWDGDSWRYPSDHLPVVIQMTLP